MANFDALHSRVNDGAAVACAFDLLMLNGEDLRRKPSAERKAIVSKKLTATHPFGPSRIWIKVKNLQAPAATRANDGTF